MALRLFRPKPAPGTAAPSASTAAAGVPTQATVFVPAGAPVTSGGGIASRMRPEDAGLTLALLNRAGSSSESELRQALPGGQLRLSYQIQRDIITGSVVALEALIRWAHPERGLLTPAEFLPLAQAAGLMERIEAWALQRVCQDGAWLLSRGCTVDVALNVTAAQLIRPGFVASIEREVRTTGLPSGMLTVEIGAQDALDHLAAVRDVSLALPRRGVRLSVSDVSPGRLSPHRLRQIQVGELKIDRAFTARLDQPGADEVAEELQDIVTAARSMGARVVAEGIETNHQFEVAAAAFCDRAQGFLLGRPVPLEQIAPLVTGR